jgi:hypothetical protein
MADVASGSLGESRFVDLRQEAGMTKRGSTLLAMAAVLAVMAGPAPGRASTETIVRGGYLSVLPTTFTSVAVDRHHPTLVTFTLVGGSIWDGSFTGHTYYKAAGTLDLTSGDAWGTVDERLIGIVTATRKVGTLHVAGTFRVDGATDTAIVAENIIGGAGAFAGSTGWLEFDAFLLPTSTGYGGYHGVWRHG